MRNIIQYLEAHVGVDMAAMKIVVRLKDKSTGEEYIFRYDQNSCTHQDWQEMVNAARFELAVQWKPIYE